MPGTVLDRASNLGVWRVRISSVKPPSAPRVVPGPALESEYMERHKPKKKVILGQGPRPTTIKDWILEVLAGVLERICVCWRATTPLCERASVLRRDRLMLVTRLHYRRIIKPWVARGRLLRPDGIAKRRRCATESKQNSLEGVSNAD